jgi:hypothetical protein
VSIKYIVHLGQVVDARERKIIQTTAQEVLEHLIDCDAWQKTRNVIEKTSDCRVHLAEPEVLDVVDGRRDGDSSLMYICAVNVFDLVNAMVDACVERRIHFDELEVEENDEQVTGVGAEAAG